VENGPACAKNEREEAAGEGGGKGERKNLFEHGEREGDEQRERNEEAAEEMKLLLRLGTSRMESSKAGREKRDPNGLALGDELARSSPILVRGGWNNKARVIGDKRKKQ
jgi:hypothetical protein